MAPEYFLLASLKRPKAGRLSSKSGPDMIISCGDLRLVGSARQCPNFAVWARWGGVPKVAPELLPWPVGVLVVASMGWCSKTLSQNPRWDGVPKVGMVLQRVVPEWGGVPKVRVVFQKVVPEWGGVPKVGVMFQKVVPDSPTARWGGVFKGWVVFQKVVPESPLCILLR